MKITYFVLMAAFLVPAASGNEMPEAVAYCLDCHADEMMMELDDGSEMSVLVDAEAWMGSVHGAELFCTDCHEGIDVDEHPSGFVARSERSYILASAQLCKGCHFDTYTRTLESVHFEEMKAGNEEVPVCSDCHGAHDIGDPHDKRSMVSRSCAGCHLEIAEAYSTSVHGRAMLEDNPDTPGCADCHTAHSMQHPDSASFHLGSPQLCLRCHGDEEMMERYGISTSIGTNYLADFHGVTASLSSEGAVEDDQLVVVCVDCHGTHDIAAPASIGSERLKAKAGEVCSSCHEGASKDFPAAWLSHYPPSLEHAPLVYLVKIFYTFLIPFVIGGLALQILLHLYRTTLGR